MLPMRATHINVFPCLHAGKTEKNNNKTDKIRSEGSRETSKNASSPISSILDDVRYDPARTSSNLTGDVSLAGTYLEIDVDGT